ncbi:MAG: 16S rRNA (cytidine(1402)-2'-O)-methyltransferase [Bacilli bacterium]|nr:16S rRNA (cytidine(1402)-2'-O)-methyltransferase [Bacilli bacterium]
MKRTKSFSNEQPLLYLIATPIGNLKEMTPRALEVLSDIDIVAAEDTRNSKALLARYDIHKEMFSLREHNEIEASKHLIKLLKEGKKIAYMSDAGYPGISDPGYLLVKEAIANDIAISTINGACAFINALVTSGLPTDHFYFYGFLPPKDNEAKTILESLKDRKETIIFYESPHRIEKTIGLLQGFFPNREAVIARELTKINEEYIRGTLSELINLDFSTLKGEMVIILQGNDKEEEINENKIIERMNYFIEKGLSKKDAAEVVADEYKVNKNLIKKLTMKL